MNLFNTKLFSLFQSKKCIKLISGLSNLKICEIINIVKAAELSKEKKIYLDIVANPKIVSLIRSITDLPICISSINPLELYNCVLAGADLVEIGNFDCFYNNKENINFSLSKIIYLAEEVRNLIKDKDICVTIPYYLNLYDQVNLSKQLENIGINILQTEGFYSDSKMLSDNLLLDSINNSIAPLSSTYAISSVVDIPIITSSKVDHISSSFSILCGASAIGLGSNIFKQKTIYGMSCYIDEIHNSLDYNFIYSEDTILSLVKKQTEYCLSYN